MQVYGGIDLHSNNNYVALLDEGDRLVYRQRLSNELGEVLRALQPYQAELMGVVVESTYNWYWLVDGLMEAGYRVHLANPAAIQQYKGLKYSDDRTDAVWLARMLRLGVLPEGYIYPKVLRGVRDLLRHRSWLVRQHTSHLLHVGNIVARNRGKGVSGQRLRSLDCPEVQQLLPQREAALAVETSLAVMRLLEEKIQGLEKQVQQQLSSEPSFRRLEGVYGIGKILAMTIWLETGDIRRFDQVGEYASYCRCVDSRRLSNDKKKGENNRHNGNKYLGWAYVEAAHHAARYYPAVERYVAKKSAQKNRAVALKAVAHKLARACYYILRDGVGFDPGRLFGSSGLVGIVSPGVALGSTPRV